MPTQTKYQIVIAALAALVIVLVAALAVKNQTAGPGTPIVTPATSTTPTPSTASSTPTSSEQTPSPKPTTKPSTTPPPATSNGSIRLLTPISGESWTITQQNTISWSKAAGVSGQISLLDAKTFKLVGVINPQTGPRQTSYAWNTRDLLLTRSNPLKTTVVPGTYVVRISFDGNNLSSITSGPVTIVP